MGLAQVGMGFLDDDASFGKALRRLAGDGDDFRVDRRDAEIGRIGDAPGRLGVNSRGKGTWGQTREVEAETVVPGPARAASSKVAPMSSWSRRSSTRSTPRLASTRWRRSLPRARQNAGTGPGRMPGPVPAFCRATRMPHPVRQQNHIARAQRHRLAAPVRQQRTAALQSA